MHYQSVLLLPTRAFATRSWDAVVSRLSHDVNCRTVALPGHGETSRVSDLDLTDIAAELATWAEGCPEPPHVVGSGIGALLAEGLARTAPTASLTVICGADDRLCRPVDVQALTDLWHAEFHEVPAAGHATHVDAPSEVAQVLIQVIRSADRKLTNYSEHGEPCTDKESHECSDPAAPWFSTHPND